MDTTLEPQLAPPGAGLPAVELMVGRLLFRWRRLTGNRERFNARFQRERQAVRAMLRNCDAETGARRVLIQRVRGLEDSSRYWSVWMTLDHLRIVHSGITRTIGALAKGVIPPGKASTAAVKPNPDVTAAVLDEYEKSCDALLAAVAAVPDLNTKVRYEHPWFGPLNASEWHTMAGGHLGIHRRQLERIFEGLTKQQA